MKKLLLVTLLFLFGFDHIKTMQDSFGMISAYYTIEQKEQTMSCENCTDELINYFKLLIINNQLEKSPYIKASSFVIHRRNSKTYVMTSNHVCKSIKQFLSKESKFNVIGNKLMDNMIKEGFFANKEVGNLYEIKPHASIIDFTGKSIKIEKIVKTSAEKDLCILQTNKSWGVKIQFANADCYYEEIFNLSASGGYYMPNALPLRRGIFNSIASSETVGEKVFKDINLYTLNVLPGASGSAVFNNQGKVCGNINISYPKLGISFGASRNDLIAFFEMFQKSL